MDTILAIIFIPIFVAVAVMGLIVAYPSKIERKVQRGNDEMCRQRRLNRLIYQNQKPEKDVEEIL